LLCQCPILELRTPPSQHIAHQTSSASGDGLCAFAKNSGNELVNGRALVTILKTGSSLNCQFLFLQGKLELKNLRFQLFQKLKEPVGFMKEPAKNCAFLTVLSL
jgi:hypothetical protein